MQLLSDAFRPPRGGINERLICQSLFQGTFTEVPSKKINHLCIAAMSSESFYSQDSEKQVPFEIEQVKMLYAINSSLDLAEAFKIDDYGSELVNIPWAFMETEANYEKYVRPWADGIELHGYKSRFKGKTKIGIRIYHDPRYEACGHTLTKCTVQEEQETLEETVKTYTGIECPRCGQTILQDEFKTEHIQMRDHNPPHQYFYAVSNCLRKMEARQLKSRFYAWAVPILEKAKMQMAGLVNPQTYEEIVKMFTRTNEERPHEPAS